HPFDGLSEGAGPNGGLIQASDGHLYGTTGGTVFKITLGGTLTTLQGPVFGSNGNLVEGFGGFIYGTTAMDGMNGCGRIFRLAPDGTFTTIHSFAGTPNGCRPFGGLARGADALLYGTTYNGGATTLGPLFRARLPRQVD